MIFESKPTKKDLYYLFNNLKKEDNEELSQTYSKNDFDKFYDLCTKKNNEVYFLKNENHLPIAIGGVYKENNKFHNIGQIWLLSTKNVYKDKKETLKYVFKKIEVFKNKYDILYNKIYKSNYLALSWLEKRNFQVIETQNDNYKLFYYIKGGNKFDIRYFTS